MATITVRITHTKAYLLASDYSRIFVRQRIKLEGFVNGKLEFRISEDGAGFERLYRIASQNGFNPKATDRKNIQVIELPLRQYLEAIETT